MSAPPDEAYFTWLYAQIGIVKLKNPSRTHWSLARQLYQKEFVWFIANDDNRKEDGLDLRGEFLREFDLVDQDERWQYLGCSMLEMLIALSRRLFFMTDIEPREWFWELLENLDVGMARTNDRHYNQKIHDEIEEVLDRVIWRTYDSDGNGGLFPLSDPKSDQRYTEIWYQLSAYLAPDM